MTDGPRWSFRSRVRRRQANIYCRTADLKGHLGPPVILIDVHTLIHPMMIISYWIYLERKGLGSKELGRIFDISMQQLQVWSTR